ncbi:MAG: hypothetical protein WCK52_03535 [Betaproteobacteria bacterium]
MLNLFKNLLLKPNIKLRQAVPEKLDMALIKKFSQQLATEANHLSVGVIKTDHKEIAAFTETFLSCAFALLYVTKFELIKVYGKDSTIVFEPIKKNVIACLFTRLNLLVSFENFQINTLKFYQNEEKIYSHYPELSFDDGTVLEGTLLWEISNRISRHATSHMTPKVLQEDMMYFGKSLSNLNITAVVSDFVLPD